MRFEFVEKKARKAVDFFRHELKYVEGKLAGKPFDLRAWQEDIVRDLFGWCREDGTRRYRTAFIEVPRGNGKSTLAAGIALYLLLRDGEARPQIYSAGGSTKQARIVFDTARAMVSANPRFELEAELRQYQIIGLNNGGWYEAISAESYSSHGYAAHGVIFDEVHVQPNRGLWDVLEDSKVKRHQPLTFAITTAGHDRSSICWELHKRAMRVIEEPESDPSFYAKVWGAEAAEDWTSEEVWKKANPNFGVSVHVDHLREACLSAIDNPEKENNFRNMHLNQWTEQAVRWIPLHLWDKCRREFDLVDLRGRKCFGALDLASTRDVCAMVLLFPESDGTFKIVPHFWIPEKSKGDRAHQDRRQVLNWAAKGIIEKTPDDVCDYYAIARHVREVFEEFDVQMFCYDPWGPARAWAQIAERIGLDMTRIQEFRQIISNFATPSKEFERLITSGRLHHNGNEVMRWMIGNVSAERDKNDNIRPDKKNSADKIDGVVATIMALGLSIAAPEMASIYERENRGFITIG